MRVITSVPYHMAPIGFKQWKVLAGESGIQRRQRDQGIYYSCPFQALKKFWSDHIHSDYGSCHISPSSTVPELTVLYANRSQLLLVSWFLNGTCWFPSPCPHPSISSKDSKPCTLPLSFMKQPGHSHETNPAPWMALMGSLFVLASSEKFNSSCFFDS